MRNISTSTCLLLICLVFQGKASSQDNLIQLANEAKNVQVKNNDRLGQKLKNDLYESLEHLKQIVAKEKVQVTNWKPAPHLAAIEGELAKPAHDVETLNLVAKNFYGSSKRLDRPEYLRLRNSLRAYIYWLRTAQVGNPEDYQKLYETHLQKMVEELGKDTHNPDLAEVSPAFNWLFHSGHAQQFVKGFQARFSHPAGMIDVNPNLGEQGVQQFSKEIDQTQYTTNMIAGAKVAGDSQLTGKVRAMILDNPERATVRVYIEDGLIQTQDSIGRKDIPALKGTVLVNGAAKTYVEHAYVDIYFDGKKIVCTEPVVKCRTQSSIRNVSFSRKYMLPSLKKARRSIGMGPDMLEKFVRKQAIKASQKKKAQAEQESSEIAAKTLAKSIKEEVAENLTEIASKIENELANVIEPNMVRQGIYFDKIITQSSSNRLRLAFDKRGLGQLGACKPTVSHQANMNSVMELMVHESSFLNFFAERAAGARWYDTTWAFLQKTVTGLNSYAFMIGTRERWSCEMDWDAPVSIRFNDDCITFNFRIRSFNIEGNEFKFPFQVSSSYKLSVQHYGIDLIRQGDVKIRWLEEVPKDETFKSFVMETFVDLMQDQQHWDSLNIPYGGAWGDMDKLRFESFTIKNGWFNAKVSPNKYEEQPLLITDN